MDFLMRASEFWVLWDLWEGYLGDLLLEGSVRMMVSTSSLIVLLECWVLAIRQWILANRA